MDRNYKEGKINLNNSNLPKNGSSLKTGYNWERSHSSSRRPYQKVTSCKLTTRGKDNKNTVNEEKIGSSTSDPLITNSIKRNTLINNKGSQIPIPYLTERWKTLNKSDGNKKRNNNGEEGKNKGGCLLIKEQSTNIEDLNNQEQQNKRSSTSIRISSYNKFFIDCVREEGRDCVCYNCSPGSDSLEKYPNNESKSGTSSSIGKITPEPSPEEDMKETSESSSLSFFTDKSSVSVYPLGDFDLGNISPSDKKLLEGFYDEESKTLLDISHGSDIAETTVIANPLINNDSNKTTEIKKKSKEDEKLKDETQTEKTDEVTKTTQQKELLKEQTGSDSDTDGDGNDDNENDEVEDEEKNEESEASMLVDDNLEMPKHQQPKELTSKSEEELQKEEKLKEQEEEVNYQIKEKLKSFIDHWFHEKNLLIYYDSSVLKKIYLTFFEAQTQDSNLEVNKFIEHYIEKNLRCLLNNKNNRNYNQLLIFFDEINSRFVMKGKKSGKGGEYEIIPAEIDKKSESFNSVENDNKKKNNKTIRSLVFFIVGFFAIVAAIYFIYTLIEKNNKEEENNINDDEKTHNSK